MGTITPASDALVDGMLLALQGNRTRTEINAADELPLKPRLSTLKYNCVEIIPNEGGISGRKFDLDAEPKRY